MAAAGFVELGRTAGDACRRMLIMITDVIILLRQCTLPLLVTVVQIQQQVGPKKEHDGNDDG